MENYWCLDASFIETQHNLQEKFENSNQLCLNQIPKQIHFIWLGSDLPNHCENIISRCKILHPDWNIKVWQDRDVDNLPVFHNRSFFKDAPNFGMKSDILRYEILMQYGGVYSDVDYEWLRPLDRIVENCTFFAGLANTAVVEVNNGFIGSVPGHPLLDLVISQVEKNCYKAKMEAMEAKNLQLMNTLLGSFLTADESKNLASAQAGSGFKDTIRLTGPGMLTKVLATYLTTTPTWSCVENDAQCYDRTVVFDKDFFSAIPNTIQCPLSDKSEAGIAEREEIKLKYATDRSIVVHWWQKSWYKL